jgi:hypothetical protein
VAVSYRTRALKPNFFKKNISAEKNENKLVIFTQITAI